MSVNFEERLLRELRGLVTGQRDQAAERGGRLVRARSRRRLLPVAGAAAVLAVAAAAGVPLLSGGAEAAYAVTRNGDGTVTVEIASLRDAAGLERKLREAAVPAVVQYLPPGKACRPPWPGSVSPAHSPAGPGDEHSLSGVEHTSDGHVRFTIGKHHPTDQTLVITTQVGAAAGGPGAESPTAVAIAFASGEVAPCEIVDAPAGSPPFGAPPAGAVIQTAGVAAP